MNNRSGGRIGATELGCDNPVRRNPLFHPVLKHGQKIAWGHAAKESVELAALEWVSWFNYHRLLEPIGCIPPAEAEANYYRQHANEVTAPA